MKYLANLMLFSVWVSLTSALSRPRARQEVLSLPKSAPEIHTTETCGNPAHGVPFYRTYHSAFIDHWYTPDVQRINEFLPQGFALEGIAGLVFVTEEPGTTQLYRLYSSAAKDNYYTTSAAERDAALKNGYAPDDVSFPLTWIYPNRTCGSIPLFHLYNRLKKDNFYTISDSERVEFISNRGYADASSAVAGYVLPVGASRCSTCGLHT
ncbi:hypothetical protein MVEN_00287000 [Mycena venus]|uniref:DUF5648 domain-containing protein n=1 Tax=Mycena venus TaxID=2733690 RepID=A0A8H7DE28_9AGAR|nr:hypothetical protein MVEN_00287000 [Mycena venus]